MVWWLDPQNTVTVCSYGCNRQTTLCQGTDSSHPELNCKSSGPAITVFSSCRRDRMAGRSCQFIKKRVNTSHTAVSLRHSWHKHSRANIRHLQIMGRGEPKKFRKRKICRRNPEKIRTKYMQNCCQSLQQSLSAAESPAPQYWDQQTASVLYVWPCALLFCVCDQEISQKAPRGKCSHEGRHKRPTVTTAV